MESSALGNEIKVAIRVRPLLPKEQATGLKSKWLCTDTTINPDSSQASGHSYVFDRVFNEDVSNRIVYEELAADIVKQAMIGFNGTLFTYGQSGSGKTYTIDSLRNFAIKSAYDYIENCPAREFLMRVSYIELYNEKLMDLLSDDNTALVVREDNERNVSIEGLKEIIVKSQDHVKNVLTQGNARRTFAATKLNDRSSRAHCIFRLVIESRERDDPEHSSVYVSYLNLVDLAGSERAGESSGERLREGVLINLSLLTLSQVIRKLSGEQREFINYRDSKLTRILQNALEGNSKTAILCTVAPVSVEETHSTLRFALNAKKVKTKPLQNEVLTDSAMLKKSQLEISRLKNKIKELEGRNSFQENDELLLQKEKWKNLISEVSSFLCVSSKAREEKRPDKKRRETVCVPRNYRTADVMDALPPLMPSVIPKVRFFEQLQKPAEIPESPPVNDPVFAVPPPMDSNFPSSEDSCLDMTFTDFEKTIVHECVMEKYKSHKAKCNAKFASMKREVAKLKSKLRHKSGQFVTLRKRYKPNDGLGNDFHNVVFDEAEEDFEEDKEVLINQVNRTLDEEAESMLLGNGAMKEEMVEYKEELDRVRAQLDSLTARVAELNKVKEDSERVIAELREQISRDEGDIQLMKVAQEQSALLYVEENKRWNQRVKYLESDKALLETLFTDKELLEAASVDRSVDKGLLETTPVSTTGNKGLWETTPVGRIVDKGLLETTPVSTTGNKGLWETNPVGRIVDKGLLETSPVGRIVDKGLLETSPVGIIREKGLFEASPVGRIEDKNDQEEIILKQNEILNEWKQIIKFKEELNEQVKSVESKLFTLEEERDTLNKEKDWLNGERNTVNEEKDRLNEEKNRVSEEKGRLDEERDRIHAEWNNLEKAYNELRQEKEEHLKEHIRTESFVEKLQALREENDNLRSSIETAIDLKRESQAFAREALEMSCNDEGVGDDTDRPNMWELERSLQVQWDNLKQAQEIFRQEREDFELEKMEGVHSEARLDKRGIFESDGIEDRDKEMGLLALDGPRQKNSVRIQQVAETVDNIDVGIIQEERETLLKELESLNLAVSDLKRRKEALETEIESCQLKDSYEGSPECQLKRVEVVGQKEELQEEWEILRKEQNELESKKVEIEEQTRDVQRNVDKCLILEEEIERLEREVKLLRETQWGKTMDTDTLDETTPVRFNSSDARDQRQQVTDDADCREEMLDLAKQKEMLQKEWGKLERQRAELSKQEDNVERKIDRLCMLEEEKEQFEEERRLFEEEMESLRQAQKDLLKEQEAFRHRQLISLNRLEDNSEYSVETRNGDLKDVNDVLQNSHGVGGEEELRQEDCEHKQKRTWLDSAVMETSKKCGVFMRSQRILGEERLKVGGFEIESNTLNGCRNTGDTESESSPLCEDESGVVTDISGGDATLSFMGRSSDHVLGVSIQEQRGQATVEENDNNAGDSIHLDEAKKINKEMFQRHNEKVRVNRNSEEHEVLFEKEQLQQGMDRVRQDEENLRRKQEMLRDREEHVQQSLEKLKTLQEKERQLEMERIQLWEEKGIFQMEKEKFQREMEALGQLEVEKRQLCEEKGIVQLEKFQREMEALGQLEVEKRQLSEEKGIFQMEKEKFQRELEALGQLEVEKRQLCEEKGIVQMEKFQREMEAFEEEKDGENIRQESELLREKEEDFQQSTEKVQTLQEKEQQLEIEKKLLWEEKRIFQMEKEEFQLAIEALKEETENKEGLHQEKEDRIKMRQELELLREKEELVQQSLEKLKTLQEKERQFKIEREQFCEEKGIFQIEQDKFQQEKNVLEMKKEVLEREKEMFQGEKEVSYKERDSFQDLGDLNATHCDQIQNIQSLSGEDRYGSNTNTWCFQSRERLCDDTESFPLDQNSGRKEAFSQTDSSSLDGGNVQNIKCCHCVGQVNLVEDEKPHHGESEKGKEEIEFKETCRDDINSLDKTPPSSLELQVGLNEQENVEKKESLLEDLSWIGQNQERGGVTCKRCMGRERSDLKIDAGVSQENGTEEGRKQLEEDKERLQSEWDNLRQSQDDLKKEEDKVSQMSAELEEKMQEVLERERNRTDKDGGSTEQERSEPQNCSGELTEQMQELEDELECKVLELEKAERKIEALQKLIVKGKAMLAEKTDLAFDEKERQLLQEERALLEEEWRNFKLAQDDFNREKEAEKDYEIKNEQVQLLEEKQKRLQQSLFDLKQAEENLKREHDQIKSQEDSLQAELRQLQSLQQEKVILQGDIQRLDDERSLIEEEMKRSIKQKEILQGEIQRLDDERSLIEKEMTNYINEKEILQKELMVFNEEKGIFEQERNSFNMEKNEFCRQKELFEDKKTIFEEEQERYQSERKLRNEKSTVAEESIKQLQKEKEIFEDKKVVLKEKQVQLEKDEDALMERQAVFQREQDKFQKATQELQEQQIQLQEERIRLQEMETDVQIKSEELRKAGDCLRKSREELCKKEETVERSIERMSILEEERESVLEEERKRFEVAVEELRKEKISLNEREVSFEEEKRRFYNEWEIEKEENSKEIKEEKERLQSEWDNLRQSQDDLKKEEDKVSQMSAELEEKMQEVLERERNRTDKDGGSTEQERSEPQNCSGELTEQMQELEDELECKVLELEKAERKIEDLQKLIVKGKAMLEEKIDLAKQANDKAKELEESIDALKSTLKNQSLLLDSKSEELEKLKGLQQNYKAAIREQDDLKEEIETLTKGRDGDRKYFEDIIRQLRLKHREAQNADASFVEQRRDPVPSSTDQLRKAIELENAAKFLELNKLRKTVEEQQAQIKSLEAERAQLQEDCKTLQLQLDNEAIRSEALLSTISQKALAKNTAEEELAQLYKQLMANPHLSKDETTQMLRNQLKDKDQLIGQLNKTIDFRNCKLSSIAAKHKGLIQENRGYQKTVAELMKENVEVEKLRGLSKQSKEISEHLAVVHSNSKQLTTLQKENSELKASVVKLKSEVQEMRSKTSHIGNGQQHQSVSLEQPPQQQQSTHPPNSSHLSSQQSQLQAEQNLDFRYGGAVESYVIAIRDKEIRDLKKQLEVQARKLEDSQQNRDSIHEKSFGSDVKRPSDEQRHRRFMDNSRDKENQLTSQH